MGWYRKAEKENKLSLRLYEIPKEGGETLLELVISIGLFAITMLMVAVMFTAANRTTEKNFRTEVEMDEAVSDIVKEENISRENSLTITFQIPGRGTVAREVERIEAQGLFKFRQKP